MVVKKYKNGDVIYTSLANKYCIPSFSPIIQWVYLHSKFGEEGLKRKKSKEVYSVHFKLDVLQFTKRTGSSYQETALSFGIREFSVIANWNRAFNKEGLEGLKPKSKGRPSMSKQLEKKKMNSSQNMSREKELFIQEVLFLCLKISCTNN